jgi:hypothetical protein
MAKQAETNVWKNIQLCLSPLGFRLMRNQRYKGQIVSRGKVLNSWVDAGVGGNGGHDLIGFRILTITKEMVGKKIAQFCAVESKDSGTASDEQKTFLQFVNESGGLSGICYNNDDAFKLAEDGILRLTTPETNQEPV